MLKKTARKITSILIVLTIIVSMLPAVTTAAAAGTPPNAGKADGSSLWPYIIDEPSDLTWLSAQVAGGTNFDGMYFLQTADISMSGVADWTPIGNAAASFRGHYNGNGHTISGLSCTSALDNVGLFGYIGGGSISNVTLSDFTIVNAAPASGSPKNTGTLAGSCYAEVTNCHVTGASSVTCDVAYTSTIGGLVGHGGGVLNKCSSSAAVSSSYGITILGGIIGSNSASIENCLFNGSVTNSAGTAANGAGGISGYIANASVKKCVSLGSITSNSPLKGGIVGNVYHSSSSVVYINADDGNYFLSGTAANAYGQYYSPIDSPSSAPSDTGAAAKTEAELKTTATYTGLDFAGVWKNDTDGVTYPCLRNPPSVTTSVVDTSNPANIVVSAFVNSDGGSDVTARGVEYIRPGDGAYTQMAAAGAGTGGYTVPLSDLPLGTYTVRAYAVNNVATVYGETFEYTITPSGIGTAGDPYIVDSAEALNFVRYEPAASYKLICHLDLTATPFAGWVPIGTSAAPFTGIFNGNGFTVSGYTAVSYYDSTLGCSCSGLFGVVGTGGIVQNLGVSGAVSGAMYVGGIAAYNKGTITQCRNTADLSSTFTDTSIGGIAGYTEGTISNCYNTGNISSYPIEDSWPYVGGIASFDGGASNIINCYNAGNISGGVDGSVAGIVGYAEGNITGCFNAGIISGDDSATLGGVSVGGTLTNCDFLKQGALTINGSGGAAGQDAPDYFSAGDGTAYSAGFYTTASWDFSGVWYYKNGDYPQLKAFVKTPAVTGIAPTGGSTLGGTSVTITGMNFTPGAAVSFGGTPAESVTFISDTSLTAVSPAHAVGTVDITVTTAGGTSATDPAARFTYIIPNTAPSFVGGDTTLTVNANASAADVKGLLHVSDTDDGQTLTWTQLTAPSHGTLSIAGATAGSGGTDITPGGTITYTPAADYYGPDSFVIRVSDGTATATRTINVTVRSNDASLLSVAGQTDGSPGTQGGTGTGDAIAWELSLEQPAISRGSIAVAANATFNLYSDAGFTTEITGSDTLALAPGMVTKAYVKVTAQDTATVKYYAVALARAATFDFEANTYPIADGSTSATTVTQVKNGETIIITSTGGKFFVDDETAIIGYDCASLSGKAMIADPVFPYSTRIRVSLQPEFNFDLNSFGLFDIDRNDHISSSILLISSSGATLNASALIDYGSNDYGEAIVDVSGNAGFKNITYFDLYASGSNMQLALDNINIVFSILSDNAGLTSVAGQTDNTPGEETGADAAHAITWGIGVASAKAALGRADIAVAADATFNLFSDAAFTTEVTGANTIALTAGGATTVYIKVTAQDMATVKYYAVTINRAPAPPTVTLSVVPDSIAEAGGSATVTATLSHTYNADVTVNLTFTGTATGGGEDYTASASSITVPAGQLAGTVTITAAADTLDEADETVTIDITGVTNGTEDGTQVQKITITDDDPEPSISVNDPSVAEGNTGTTSLAFTVTLSAASGKIVTVNYATADGTATVGSDYVSTSGTLTFSPGETSETVSVTVNGDFFNEADETVLLNLSGASNAAISDSQGVGTIVNDDRPMINSATYNCSTGTLVVNGANIPEAAGFDIDASKLTVMGEGGVTYTLTNTPDVERDSLSQFTLTLSAADKAAVNMIFNKDGTASTGGTAYNLAAADGWAVGAEAGIDTADVTNSLTVANVAAPTITSAEYDASTGTLTVTGTGFLMRAGINNDVVVNKLTVTGEGDSTHTLTSSDVDITSGTSFTVTMNDADKAALGQILNKNGTTSFGGTTYNLAVAEDWAAGAWITVEVADTTDNSITVSGVAPRVMSVSASTDNGSYKAGDIIIITVTFNDNVMVTGTPQLTLETGSTDRMVNYSGGIGTGTLTFAYTVQDGDSAADLDYATAGALVLNGGTIMDAAGNVATLPLPAPGSANSLGANKDIVIDTTRPGITAASCALSAGNAYIDVVFNEPVYGADDGTAALAAEKLALTFTQNGGTATNAVIRSVKQNNYTSEGAASALAGGETIIRVFLTITGTPNGLETIEIKPADGASVYDKAGNAMPALQTTGIKTLHDQTPPTLLSAVRTDDTHITVTLSKSSVNIDKANDGGFTVTETGAPGTAYTVSSIAQGSDAGHVVLTVADIGASAKEGVTVKYTAGGNGTVQDTLGNVMDTDGAGVTVAAWDEAAPVISSGTLSSGNTYIDVVFSEGVYGAADGTTALAAGQLALTFTQNGGTATNAVISAVKQNDNTAEGSASALTGGETTVRVFLTITGTPNGLETIELKPLNAASVYDKAGNAALASQTTGVKQLRNPTPPAPPSEDKGANVEVNGQSYSAGQSENSTNVNGQTVTTVTVDTKKLEDILENQGKGAVVTIPVTTGSQVASGVLTGQMVDTMEQNGATLVIETETAAFTLPAEEINIGAVARQLGENVTLADIIVTVGVSEPSDTMAAVVEDAASDGGFALVVPAVEFTVSCTYNGQTVDVTSFNAYVERTIRIPDGADPSKITTAVVVAPDGTTRHVPTRITIIDGIYYAVVNSLTNSVYSVIWNPVVFTDATDSWAKDAINNMGSRMILTGVGGNKFDPDRDITRAEFAAVAVRALGLPAGVGDVRFADVKDGIWYAPYIETAVSYGLITGGDGGLFHPGDAITREQAMTLIARAMKLTGLGQNRTPGDIGALLGAFPDGQDVSGYARSGAAACVKTGIILGKYGRLAPHDFITRAEVAVIIHRLLEKSNLI